jgi:hypothetical protein
VAPPRDRAVVLVGAPVEPWLRDPAQPREKGVQMKGKGEREKEGKREREKDIWWVGERELCRKGPGMGQARTTSGGAGGGAAPTLLRKEFISPAVSDIVIRVATVLRGVRCGFSMPSCAAREISVGLQKGRCANRRTKPHHFCCAHGLNAGDTLVHGFAQEGK